MKELFFTAVMKPREVIVNKFFCLVVCSWLVSLSHSAGLESEGMLALKRKIAARTRAKGILARGQARGAISLPGGQARGALPTSWEYTKT